MKLQIDDDETYYEPHAGEIMWAAKWHTYATESSYIFASKIEALEKLDEVRQAFHVILGRLYEDKIHLFKLGVHEITDDTRMIERVQRRLDASAIGKFKR
jgi:hypothetical protein